MPGSSADRIGPRPELAVTCGSRLRDQPERLRPGAVARVLHQLNTVGRPPTGHIETLATVPGNKAVVAAAFGDGLPLLVVPTAVGPQVDKSVVRVGHVAHV